MTVATLGIEVNSLGAKQATADLDALAKASGTAEAAAANFGRASAGVDAQINKLAASVGATTQAFKLNRIGMMELQAAGINSFQALAAGMDPLRVAMMESSQVIGAFVQGTEGGLKGLGSSIVGLVTRFPLLTAAIAVAGAAFTAYELLGKHAAEDLDKALKAHAQTISDLQKAYGIAGDAADDYGRRSTAALEAAERRARAILRDSVAEADKAAKSALSDSGGFSGVGLLQRLGLLGGDDLHAVKLEFAAFSEPIEKLRQQIRDGKPDYDAFQQSLQRIANTDPSRLQPVADKILGIIDTAAHGHDQINSVGVALDQISQNQIDTARIVAQIHNIEEAAKNAQGAGDALLKMLDHMDQLAAGIAPKESAIGGKGAMGRAQNQFDNSANLALRMNPELLSGLYKPPREDHATDRAAAAYQQVLKSAQNRIDQMKVELQLTGQVGVAADTLRNYQELLSRATDRGRAIGEKQKEELHARAEEMAKLEQATKAAKLAQDLLFERQQMFRSPIEQDVNERLRSAGIDINSADGQADAELIRMNDHLQEARDLAGDFVSTFIDGLKQGESAWKAFGDAALQVLEKIGQKMLDSALNNLFGSLFGGGLSSTALSSVAGGIGGLYANGGVFDHGISAYSNSIVSSPTLFKFAHGSGLMGEAGPEAIMPLRRGSDGRLGVAAANDRAANQNAPVVNIFDQRSASNSEGVDVKRSEDGKQIDVYVRDAVRDEVTRPSAKTNRSLRGTYALQPQLVTR